MDPNCGNIQQATVKTIILTVYSQKYDALCNLGPFVQFKKRGKHPWRSVTFSF